MANNAAAAALRAKQQAPAIPEPQAQPATAANEAAKAWNQTSREGKSNMGAWLPNDFKRSLALARAYSGKNNEALYAEALNMLFEKYNAPVIQVD